MLQQGETTENTVVQQQTQGLAGYRVGGRASISSRHILFRRSWKAIVQLVYKQQR